MRSPECSGNCATCPLMAAHRPDLVSSASRNVFEKQLTIDSTGNGIDSKARQIVASISASTGRPALELRKKTGCPACSASFSGYCAEHSQAA